MKFDVSEEDKNKSGIYKIVNLVDGKYYYGSAVNFWKRYHDHLSKLKKNKHHNPYIQSAINKHKIENFSFFVIELIQDKNSLIFKEQEYIDRYFDGQINCYNMMTIAGSRFGSKHSPETREKMKQSSKHLKPTPGIIEKIRNSRLGKNHSPETREKMKLAWVKRKERGPVVSEETKRKMRESNKRNRSKKILCLNDGKIFNSATEASGFYNLIRSSVSRVATGRLKQHKGFKFKYV